MSDVSGLSDADLMAAIGQGAPPAQPGAATPDVEGMVRSTAQKYGVDPDFAVSVANRESGLQHDVRPSAKGAIGVMQLMPATAGDLGVDPTDVGQNIDGGVRYLGQQLKTFGGDRRLAAAAYNAGPGNVHKYGGVPPFKETQDYVNSVAPGPQGLSDADLMAAIGQQPDDQPPPAQEPSHYTGKGITVETGGPDPTGDGWVHQPSGLPQNDQKPNTVQDVVQQYGTGLARGVSSFTDDFLKNTNPLQISHDLAQKAADVGGWLAGKPALQVPQMAPSFAKDVEGSASAPQTTPGRYAEMTGEMTPNALAPGGFVRRALSVAFPAIGAQWAQDTAKDAGAGQIGQTVAKFGGALAGGLGSGLSIKLPQKLPKISVDDLRKEADSLYTELRNRGVSFRPSAVDSLNTGLNDLINSEGRNLYGQHASWVDQIADTMRHSPTVEALDKVRSKAQQALTTPTANTTPDQIRVGKGIIDEIDQFMGATARHPAAMTTTAPGDAQRVQQVLNQARGIWGRMRNVETVQNLAESAGIQNATSHMNGNAQNMTARKLKTFIDPATNKTLAGLSPAQYDQLRRTVLGTPLGNSLKMLGNLSPHKGIGALLAAGTAGHGDFLPAAVVGGLGYAANRGGVAVQKANLDKLIRMIASGQDPGRAGLRYSAGPMDPFNIGTVLALSQPAPAPAPAGR